MTDFIDNKIHYLNIDSDGIELPSEFTFPFHYTPHPLTVKAAHEVQNYIASRTDWTEELSAGKMFGVLIVQTPDERVGYLAAFSGNLAGSNLHQFFVPPVYDLLQPDGFFRIEEANISAINKQIKELEDCQQLKDMRSRLAACQAQASQTLADAKQQMKEAKLAREQRRAEGISEEEQKNLIRETVQNIKINAFLIITDIPKLFIILRANDIEDQGTVSAVPQRGAVARHHFSPIIVRRIRRAKHHLHLLIVCFGEKMHHLLHLSVRLKKRIIHILFQGLSPFSGYHTVCSIIIYSPVADIKIGIILQLLNRLIIPVGVLPKAFFSSEKCAVRISAVYTEPGCMILQIH